MNEMDTLYQELKDECNPDIYHIPTEAEMDEMYTEYIKGD